MFLIFHSVTYFLIQKYVTNWHYISVSLDYKIPFVSAFIIPYVLWYVYVVVTFAYILFTSISEFKKVTLMFIIGDLISLTTYVAYPTAIDFRPTTFTESGILISLVRLIYANDKPVNVCPSLHCYVSMVMNIAIVNSKSLEGKKLIKVLSSILMISICLSTMFIKQHSVIDFVVSAIMALVLYCLIYKNNLVKCLKND